ncbi:MAG: hypothetical protein ACE5H4_11745 [Candidatus Thorarchaeota archaeon]
MRGRKGKINNSPGILSTAIYMGLVALNRLARNRVSRKTRRYCQSIKKIWVSVRNSLEEQKGLSQTDFSPVQNAEPNMRGQFLKIVWTSTKRYGNREFKRVYSWLEGTVGPLNALLNYAGARLRDLAMILYPFPRPLAFQIREYPDGSKKTLTKIEADKIVDDTAVKVYWRYGYEREGKSPRIFLAHPTLPGLDFVDMIRAHCVELCRQCFIYHVPLTEAHRYIRLLIHRLRPFLDWIYTDGQEGRPNFNPHADHELRKIVLEIRALYKKRTRSRQRISKRHGENSINLSLERVRKMVIKQLANTTDLDEQRFLLEFLDYIDTGLVADEDVKKTIEQIRGKVARRLERTTNTTERKSLQKMLDYTDTWPLEDHSDKTAFQEVREKIVKQLTRTSDQTVRECWLKLLDYLDINAGYILDRDVEKLVEQVLFLSQREGNEWHRILLSDLHHPASLKQVAFLGDKMLDSLASVLVVAELPVARRSGQVDLTIFIRREIAGRILWTPVMVLEIKTKTALDFNLYGMRIKRKWKTSVVPAFYAWKRAMSDDEWKTLVTSGPDKSALEQLRDYELEVLDEYKRIAVHDPTPPTSLWKGVIVLDTDQSPIEVFPAFHYLLEDLMTGLLHQIVEQDTPISVVPGPLSSGDDAPRVALLVAPSRGPTELLQEMVSPGSLPVEDPFIDRETDARVLTLYVSIPSPTSSGITAARFSRDWHLLHHVQECIETSPTPIEEVVWLDLMGDYKTDELVRRRFGLDALLHEQMIPKRVHRQLTSTLRSIRFLDLSTDINEIIIEGAEALDRLVRHIETVLPEKENGERIVVLDGWTELRDMVPRYQQNLVRALEQRMLDTLPQSNINIIWIDSGVSHTRMNCHYQRRGVSPVRHDSPRRTHLDEIIYNIPTMPSRFGWLTPQAEDVRIIVQDTPAKADPWSVAIHVPQLVGFAEKFRGLAKRDKIVVPDVMVSYTTHITSMHGRGVTLSEIYASTGRLSYDSFSKVLEDALTLAPSVLRCRVPASSEEEVGKEPPSEGLPWQSVIQTVSSDGGSTMGDRMVLDVKRPPPTPRRGEKRYTDVFTDSENSITRRWFYERTPKQFQEDEDAHAVSSYPPVVGDTGAGEIDTIETRELELRRLYYATRHLSDRSHLTKSLRDCCRRIERFCAKQFAIIQEDPSMKTPEFFLDALRKIRKTILEDPKRVEVWRNLVPLRQGLLDLLNSENRLAMEDVMEMTPDVLLLYGNNLFLAVLAALEGRNLSIAEHLWSSVAEWTLYQLGMNIQDGESRSVYSFQAILSNLRTRARTLVQLDLPERAIEQEQVGAVVWRESEFGFDALLLIPYEDGFLTGLVKGLGDRWIPPKWHACATAPQDMKRFAEEALLSTDATPLVMTTVLKTKVLWVPVLTEYDDDLQWVSFSLVHGKPSGRWNRVPWLKLETTVPLASPGSVPAVPDSVAEALRRLARVRHRTIPVELMVSVNNDKKVYEVELHGNSIKERLEFSRTGELVRFLRLPVRLGGGHRSQGNTLTWDHKRDIDYGGDSLFFLKPLVHRSWFYPDEFHYPRTCKELLASTAGNEITMVIRQEDSNFRIELEDLPQDSSLRGLEEVGFDVHALGLLAECRELFDPDSRMWHPFILNVNAIMDVSFGKLHDYPRLEEAVREADVSEFDWSRDTWLLSTRIIGNELFWTIISGTTGRPWRNRTFTFILTPGTPPDKELEVFRQEVEAIAPLSHLSNLDNELGVHRVTLLERYEEFKSSLDEVIPLYDETLVFRYKGLEVRKERPRTVVVVFLESDDGDSPHVYVVSDVNGCLNDSQFAGAIDSEHVDTEVNASLTPYGIDEDLLSVIREEVKQALEEKGVTFYEQ